MFKLGGLMKHKSLDGLATASQKKKQEALSKTEKAIARLAENQQKINIRSVAREAGVSVSYIYKYPELVYKIHKLKEQQKYSLAKAKKEALTGNNQVQILEQENVDLKYKISELEAIIERVGAVKNSVKDLRADNVQLATENIQLKKELEYTLSSLQSARQFILEQSSWNIDQEELVKKPKKITLKNI